MSVQTRQCDPRRIADFLDGRLSDLEQTTLEEHLDGCAACRESLGAQTADDELWNKASRYLRDNEFELESLPRADDSTADWDHTYSIQHVLDALGPTDDPQMLGRIGGYEVLGVVGSGGMGVVLKALDKSLDRTVAIKVMAPHLASNGAARKRFAREAKAAAAVLHPNVMAIHSVSNGDSLPFLVMPYMRGASLQKRLDAEGPLPVGEILRISSQTAAGLAAAHAQGLVHRDIKPANILLEEGVERVAITDFGLARAVDDASMTRTGMIAGTPQYMSPEQARGEPLDQRSDLFSLGSVLYAMCTGRPPFRAETSYGILRRITDNEPRPIREINPDIPEWLCSIVAKLMAKQPDDRYGSAEEVAELLEDCLAHVQQPTVIPPPWRKLPACDPTRQAGSLPHRKPRKPWASVRRLIGLAAFFFALLVAGIVILLELDKGTLRIESDADNVPIRITQGDSVVEKLTVSKSGTSVRVAAGQYVVEIDGELDGITVDKNRVTLQRRGNEVVRIVRDESIGSVATLEVSQELSIPVPQIAEPKDAAGQSEDVFPGGEVVFKTNVKNLRRGKDSRFESLIQVDLSGDKDIAWLFQKEPLKREPLGYPFCVDNVSGSSLFPLIDGAGNRIQTSIRLQCANAPDGFWKRIQGVKVELHVTREDFDYVLAGNSFMKVVFLADDESQPTSLTTLSSSRLKPGTDALAEADRRGQPVVSMELRPWRDWQMQDSDPGTLHSDAHSALQPMDVELRRLSATLRNARLRRARLLQTNGAQHPEVLKLDAEINALEKRLRGESPSKEPTAVQGATQATVEARLRDYARRYYLERGKELTERDVQQVLQQIAEKHGQSLEAFCQFLAFYEDVRQQTYKSLEEEINGVKSTLVTVDSARIVPLNDLQTKQGQRLVQLDRVVAEADVDLAGRSLRDFSGAPALVTFQLDQSTKHLLRGTVTYIDPRANADGTIRVRVTVENQEHDGKWLLVPGALVKLTIYAADATPSDEREMRVYPVEHLPIWTRDGKRQYAGLLIRYLKTRIDPPSRENGTTSAVYDAPSHSLRVDTSPKNQEEIAKMLAGWVRGRERDYKAGHYSRGIRDEVSYPVGDLPCWWRDGKEHDVDPLIHYLRLAIGNSDAEDDYTFGWRLREGISLSIQATKETHKRIADALSVLRVEMLLDRQASLVRDRDYGGYVDLLADDEVDRLAGVMLHQATVLVGALRNSADVENQDTIRTVEKTAAVTKRWTLDNPPDDADEAYDLLVRTSIRRMFDDKTAALESADKYSHLFAKSAEVLKDKRLFIIDMMLASHEGESEPPLVWQIDVQGDNAVATTSTGGQKATIELKRIDGQWRISSLFDDEAIMRSVTGFMFRGSDGTAPPGPAPLPLDKQKQDCTELQPPTENTVYVRQLASASGIVARAEATALQLTRGKITPRAVRDKDGHVTMLLLNDMHLSQDDFVELGKLEHLRALVLLGTNVTDGDLSHLKQCPSLDHLNLVRTEVTDRAIDTILELKRLKSLCLGDVKITPAAIERLKAHNRQSDVDHQLQWGYSQRKPRPAEDERSNTLEPAAGSDSIGKSSPSAP